MVAPTQGPGRDPSDDPGRVPDALVLIASPSLGGELRRVRASGWVGPVVVVGDVAEATQLARSLQSLQAPEEAPVGSRRAEADAQVRGRLGAGTGSRPSLMLDPDRRMVVSGGRRTSLTPLEYAVLHALLVQPGRVCPFADLTERVWGTPFDGDTGQVHSVVKRVRRKLDSIDSPVRVQAVRGFGFRAVVGSTRP